MIPISVLWQVLKPWMNRLWMLLRLLGWANVRPLLSRVVQNPRWITYLVQKKFVETVRAVEHSLGISDSLLPLIPTLENGNFLNVTEAIATIATLSSILTSEICEVLQEAIPIICQIALELDINLVFEQDGLGSFLSTRRPLVTTCVLTSEFISTQRVDYDYDNITALWMSAGNTITLLTLPMQLTDHKDTIIIYTTRKFKIYFLLCLLTSFSQDLEYVFIKFFSHHE